MCEFFFFLPLRVITPLDLDQLMTYENKLISLIITGINIPIKANSGYYDKGRIEAHIFVTT